MTKKSLLNSEKEQQNNHPGQHKQEQKKTCHMFDFFLFIGNNLYENVLKV